jgi:hypothetical protein
MLTKNIIDSTKYTIASLLELCDCVDVNRFKITTAEEEFDYRYRINFYDDKVSKKFYMKKAVLDTLKTDNKNSKLSQDFKVSWANVKDNVYQNLMHTPIFHNLSVETIEAALRSWSNEDVYQFVRFIKERYRFNNIEDFFKSELEALKTVSSMVDNLRKEFGVGLKVASLADLHESLLEAHSRMEKQIPTE